MEAFMPDRHVDFTARGGQKVASDTRLYGVPAPGWSAPISEGSYIYFGGGMYATSGMGVDYPQTTYSPASIPTIGGAPGSTLQFRGYSDIALFQMAPAVAFKVNDQLSVGAALNIGYMSTAFQQQIVYKGSKTTNLSAPNYTNNEVLNGVNMSRSASAFGVGVTLGVLYKVNPRVTVGASYISEQTYDLKYNLAPGDITIMKTGSGCPSGTTSVSGGAACQYPGGCTSWS